MTKVELTISPNYVPSWTIVDAVRELFQNALDQEAQNEHNKASWNYDEATETLTISNATSKLNIQSLLLGQTSKADDESTIGQFGEGYKIATLVLLRNAKNIVFYNYGAKEVWRPRFVKSRRFGTDVLTFFIDSMGPLKKAPNADLTIEVSGITKEEYASSIVPTNLHLRTDYVVLTSDDYYGDVLNLPGEIYVNGLYVCNIHKLKYGYNLKPARVKLGRDRRTVSDFDIIWEISELWCSSPHTDMVMEMVVESSVDVQYINHGSSPESWYEEAYRRFLDEYGDNAIPVSTQTELDNLSSEYRGIVVSENYKRLITSYVGYVKPTARTSSKIRNMYEWFNGIKARLTTEECDRFETLITEIAKELGNGQQ